MPCFRVRLEGSGIQYPVQEGGAPIVGFFTTRQVRAGNVAEAAMRTGARLVDVSSGVERAPGVKDVDKIAAFLQSVAAS